MLHLLNRFERFVISLDEASKDKLPFLKEKALKVFNHQLAILSCFSNDFLTHCSLIVYEKCMSTLKHLNPLYCIRQICFLFGAVSLRTSEDKARTRKAAFVHSSEQGMYFIW